MGNWAFGRVYKLKRGLGLRGSIMFNIVKDDE